MTDHFAALAQSPRPWIDPEALKEAFHRASITWHPDVASTGDAARFEAASAAYTALRDPVSRLRNLLELQAPEELARPQSIPADAADLFMRVAEFQQAFTAFQKREATAAHGLARALLAGERQALLRRAGTLQAELEGAWEAAVALLRAIDADWESRAADAALRLAALHQRFAFLSKWQAQLKESLFKLSL